MRRSATIIVLLVLMASAFISYLLVRHWTRHHHRSSVIQLENELRASVRPGMSRTQIEAYLDQRGIPHSYAENADAPPESRWTELAMIRDSGWTGLVRRNIQLVFQFDQTGSLTNYSEKEMFTGP